MKALIVRMIEGDFFSDEEDVLELVEEEMNIISLDELFSVYTGSTYADLSQKLLKFLKETIDSIVKEEMDRAEIEIGEEPVFDGKNVTMRRLVFIVHKGSFWEIRDEQGKWIEISQLCIDTLFRILDLIS